MSYYQQLDDKQKKGKPSSNNNDDKTLMIEPSIMGPVTRTVSPSPSTGQTATKSVMAPVTAVPAAPTATKSVMAPVTAVPIPSAPSPSAKADKNKKLKVRRKKTRTDDDTEATKTAAEEDSAKGGDPLDAQLKKELSASPPLNKVTFEFSYDNGDYLGLTILPTLLITQVDTRPGISAFCDKLFPGDVLRALNGRSIKDLDSFYQALNRLPSPIGLTIDRPVRIRELEGVRGKRLNIDLKNGDRYFIAYILFRPKAKLGISVKAWQSYVSLLKVDEAGLAAGALEVGDVIMDVEGVIVKSTEEVKKGLLSSLQKRGFVSLVIKRPMTEQSLNITRQILGGASNSELDPEMKIDAALIGRNEWIRRKTAKTQSVPIKGILAAPSAYRPRQYQRQSIKVETNKNSEMYIWSDVQQQDWTDLESMPKREEVVQAEGSTPPQAKAKRMSKIKKFLFTRFSS